MEFNKMNILIFVQNNYHEILLVKELQVNFPEINVISVKSKIEAIQIISTESIRAIILDAYPDLQKDLCNIHQIHMSNPQAPIIALIDDNSDQFLRKLFEIGVTELLQKNETFYVAVPKLLKVLLAKTEEPHTDRSLKHLLNESEHLNLTSRTLSHEINNPLMSILGIAELILDDKSNYDKNLIEKIEKIQKSAERIQKSTHRMSNIKSPAYKKTPGGVMIDPKKSRIRIKSKV